LRVKNNGSQRLLRYSLFLRRLIENYLSEHQQSIKLNFGHYPYPDYEPMEFWGMRSRKKTSAATPSKTSPSHFGEDTGHPSTGSTERGFPKWM